MTTKHKSIWFPKVLIEIFYLDNILIIKNKARKKRFDPYGSIGHTNFNPLPIDYIVLLPTTDGTFALKIFLIQSR